MDFIDSSDDEETQNESDGELDLDISQSQADYNYVMAGTTRRNQQSKVSEFNAK
jgi:hypothetical protein